MIYANKQTILVVLTMCAIALSSVKAQEARASTRRGLKSSKSPDRDAPVSKSSKACTKLKLIADFRTKFEVPEDDSQIIEGINSAIVRIAEKVVEDIDDVTGFDDIGYVYPETVESDCGNKKCRFFTETTICVLDSADEGVVDQFKRSLLKKNINEGRELNLLLRMDSYFRVETAFKVNFKGGVNKDKVELMEY